MRDSLKRCGRCKENKDLELFSKNRRSLDGYGTRCKECDSIERKKWYRKNKERSVAYSRRTNLKNKYNMTPQDFSDMKKKQNHKCAICGCVETSDKVRHNFAVDHCHDTGAVCGLLCNQCNRAIGMLEDSPQLVLKAYQYVRRTRRK